MQRTYTWTFCSWRLAVGACGWRNIVTAMKAETQKATVVAKPKRFCTRTNAECIVFEGCKVWVVL